MTNRCKIWTVARIVFITRSVMSTLVLACLFSPATAADLSSIEFPLPRLSPRPLSMAGEAPLLSLNGTWRFHPAPPDGFERFGADETKDWKTIEVPGEWVMQGFEVKRDAAAAYWRQFDVPADWQGQRVKLRFDTVHSDCRVFVNGRQLGGHEGCFTAFEIDITDAVRPGQNVLALAVKSQSTADELASASQYAAHALGGITRKVQLFALPKLNLAAQVITTTFDREFKNARLNVHFELANESAADANAIIQCRLLGPDGRAAPGDAAGLRLVLEPAAAGAGAIRAGRILAADLSTAVESPKKWDPEHPRLYTLETELISGGNRTELCRQRFGFRQIEVRGNQLLVNGTAVKLRGACRHETHPTRGRSLTPEIWRQDVEHFRAANVNFVRTSHYPPAEEFLDLCDQYGLFVECEAPLCWVHQGENSFWKTMKPTDAKFFLPLIRANFENLAANRNHPCVTIWSLANESKWTPLFAEVNRRMKAADPTRPTAFHDPCAGGPEMSLPDIAVVHYPGESGPAQCDASSRPVLFGEYCHVECYNRCELVTDPGIRDDWGRGLARMVDLMHEHPGCLGGAIWAGIDDVFCLPGGKYVGYGMWGCISDGWRRDKPETFHVKKAYSPIRVLAGHVAAPAAGQPIGVPVRNRYLFTDLSEVRIDWRIGDEKGSISAAMRPQSEGKISIPARYATQGGLLRLTFIDPRGFVSEEEEVGVESPATLPAPVVIKSDAEWQIDQAGGQLKSARIGGRTVLVGAPKFMMLALESGNCQPVDLGIWKPTNGTAAASQAEGSIALERQGRSLRVKYDFVSKVDMNPRQWGLVFYLPRRCESLSWSRVAQWSCYPADHIGRPEGQARATGEAGLPPYANRDPGRPWSADPTTLGGNDFASTKAFIRQAALKDKDGYGISVISDGRQSVRAFVDGDHIGLLVAGFHTGGGDGFFSPHFGKERRPIKKGDHLKDEVVLELASPGAAR